MCLKPDHSWGYRDANNFGESCAASVFQEMRVGIRADLTTRQAMAAAFGTMPVKVIWQLPESDLPDQAALRQLGTGNNTKVACYF